MPFATFAWSTPIRRFRRCRTTPMRLRSWRRPPSAASSGSSNLMKYSRSAIRSTPSSSSYSTQTRNLNAPRFRVCVEYELELGVDLIALREYFIKFELPDDAADGGLRQLRSRIGVVLHLRKRLIGVDHAKVANGIDFHRDVVARDDVLRRNVERLNPHVDTVECFNRPKNKIYAGALCLGN